MTKYNTIQMLYLLLFSYLETVDKNFSFRFWDDVELLALLEDCAVALVYTQSVDFDVVFLGFVCTDIGLALFQAIE